MTELTINLRCEVARPLSRTAGDWHRRAREEGKYMLGASCNRCDRVIAAANRPGDEVEPGPAAGNCHCEGVELTTLDEVLNAHGLQALAEAMVFRARVVRPGAVGGAG